jgi:fibronectin type 3 domain-containing protein
VAPERKLPAAVQDLQAAVVGEGVRLTWTLPRVRVDRSALPAVRRTEVYRRPEGPGGPSGPVEASRPALLTFGGLFGPPSGVVGFDRVANITIAEPGAAQVRGDQVTYTDAQGLVIGQQYTYVVVAVDEQGRPSPPSNRVAVAVASPPTPPTRLAATAGDREVRLTWDAPTTLEDGSAPPPTPPVVYDVYRTAAPGAPAGRPLNPEPTAAREFRDLTTQNDATYYYSVRARLGPGGPTSRASEVVSATPEDQTPPGQPRGLVAVAAPGSVRLAWEAVADADVAGYHVYRSLTPGRGYEKLTPAPQPATTYVDTRTTAGQTYYYIVTAVDREPRANESVPSPEATASAR